MRGHPTPPHGSPAGYDDGCRSKGGCANDESSPLLTCTEAAQRRRGDFALSRLPADLPLRRDGTVHPPAPADDRDRRAPEVHGTLWGYRRGCRAPYSCPHWRTGAPTCAEARAQYFRDWAERRRRSADIAHGTSTMYLLGCRDGTLCPGDDRGQTCSQARSAYRRRLASARGVPPRVESVDAAPARRRINEWLAAGHSLRKIAQLTQCGRTTLSEITRPEHSGRTRISPQTLHRICTAEIPEANRVRPAQ